MSATVTVTGTIGPGYSLTAAVFTGVSSFCFNTVDKETLELTFTDNRAPVDIAIDAATSITITVSGSAYTVTIS